MQNLFKETFDPFTVGEEKKQELKDKMREAESVVGVAASQSTRRTSKEKPRFRWNKRLTLIAASMAAVFVFCAIFIPVMASRGGGGSDVPSVDAISLSAILSGNGSSKLISSYDEKAIEAFVKEAREEGFDPVFAPDGGMQMENALTGRVIIQAPDGSWTLAYGDGWTAQTGGDWPDNEFTALLPKPGFPGFEVASSRTDSERFNVTFAGASFEQLRAYVEQVKEKGFTIDAQTQDFGAYQYSAKNAQGYSLFIHSAFNVTVIELEKPF
ncbi:MAG: hypothetical protein FWD58_05920 [Firmicutes bacterium]|nr:hypothetical protein [Bacillota bacterium]